MGLTATPETAVFTPLAGGVSSDIFRVDLGGRAFCLKRALPKLRVAADWRAPIERNRFEIDYLSVGAQIVPGAFPALLGVDTDVGCFAMEYFDPQRYPPWKSLLRDGQIDVATAHRIGDILGRFHSATADKPELASHFATDESFHALRLGAYLGAAAEAHPDFAEILNWLIDATMQSKRVLVHGDYSPKNILIGPNGPVILDAECAWFGDPAFDLAFVLNHLLLKGAWRPLWKLRYLECFGALARAYFGHVDWEERTGLEARVADLLPALMLARIDGKSPVEYITDEPTRGWVRDFALRFLGNPVARLFELSTAWQHFDPARRARSPFVGTDKDFEP